jgi:hypothetical protein
MKLFLHIGAHKTGSTALQRHLWANRDVLTEHGLHYAAPDSAPMSNTVADALAAGHVRKVRDFFDRSAEAAACCGAQTVLISAENFYSMATISALRRNHISGDVMDERSLVHRLGQLTSSRFDDFRIICYLRRPDHFAESWYNQQIKGSSLFDGDFSAFLRIIQPALSYHTVLRIWADVFGRERCAVRIYEDCATDIFGDFLDKALSIDQRGFRRVASDVNERMSRDLVEFKRTKNSSMTLTQKAGEYHVFTILEERLTPRQLEPHGYREFLSPKDRAGLLEQLEPEMTSLQEFYDLPPFPAFDRETAAREWMPYPGLSEARRKELEREYQSIRRSWRFRVGERVRRNRYSGSYRNAHFD